MKYVVTGKNRLTGERDVISSPLPEWKARLIMERQKSRNNCKSAYSRLKVEPYIREGYLW